MLCVHVRVGQGIAGHIDHTKHFDSEIVSVSLLSEVVMNFTPADVPPSSGSASEQTIGLLLKRNSALGLSGEARYDWRHSIGRRKSDVCGSRLFPRSRRVSLTFRHIIQ
jgi:alkylated DNA repair dioxygenase AlkB